MFSEIVSHIFNIANDRKGISDLLFQVVELMAVNAKICGLSYCKVVEVITETTAPLTPMEELLAKIPSQRQEPQVCLFIF